MMIDAAGKIDPGTRPSLMKARDQSHNGFSPRRVVDRILIHSVLAPADFEKPTPFRLTNWPPRCEPQFDDPIDVANFDLRYASGCVERLAPSLDIGNDKNGEAPYRTGRDCPPNWHHFTDVLRPALLTAFRADQRARSRFKARSIMGETA